MPDKIPDRSTLNEEDFKAMMERIEASNAGQEKYAKKQIPACPRSLRFAVSWF